MEAQNQENKENGKKENSESLIFWLEEKFER